MTTSEPLPVSSTTEDAAVPAPETESVEQVPEPRASRPMMPSEADLAQMTPEMQKKWQRLRAALSAVNDMKAAEARDAEAKGAAVQVVQEAAAAGVPEAAAAGVPKAAPAPAQASAEPEPFGSDMYDVTVASQQPLLCGVRQLDAPAPLDELNELCQRCAMCKQLRSGPWFRGMTFDDKLYCQPCHEYEKDALTKMQLLSELEMAARDVELYEMADDIGVLPPRQEASREVRLRSGQSMKLPESMLQSMMRDGMTEDQVLEMFSNASIESDDSTKPGDQFVIRF